MSSIEPEILARMERLRVAPESSGPFIGPPVNGERRAVFIDRDGVIIENGHPDPDAEPPTPIEGAREAIEGFREMGYSPVVVTNQGAIGMGSITHQDLLDIMEAISARIGEPPWEMAYYSPYHPEAIIERYRRDSPDRKPGPGMLWRAASEMGLDLEHSIMVGDHLTDVLAGHAAGCASILVTTGGGKAELARLISTSTGPDDPSRPDVVAENLYHAYLAVREGCLSKE